MLERRRLSDDFVDSVQPPQTGERWIADSAVRGFGIRLWGDKASRKSFARRFPDKCGRTIRRTFSRAQGSLLSQARDRAGPEFRALKGLPGLEQFQVAWNRSQAAPARTLGPAGPPARA